MITLITGAPGSGKTASLVELLRTVYADRPLYVDGVPDLALPNNPLGDPLDWPSTVPDGALVVIDECQRVWRPRNASSKVPHSIEALETHRHRGLDFVIITQAPALIDKNVRQLVGRHIHLRDVGVLGRYWYEWPECSENLAWRSAPIKKRFRVPKAAFGLYTSASLHVKPVRSFPMALVVAILALGGTAVAAYYSYRNVSAKIAPAEVGPSGVAAPSAASSPVHSPVPSTGDYVADLNARYRPRLAILVLKTGALPYGVVEWWDGAQVVERMTFRELVLLGTKPVVRGSVLRLGDSWVTAWPISGGDRVSPVPVQNVAYPIDQAPAPAPSSKAGI